MSIMIKCQRAWCSLVTRELAKLMPRVQIPALASSSGLIISFLIDLFQLATRKLSLRSLLIRQQGSPPRFRSCSSPGKEDSEVIDFIRIFPKSARLIISLFRHSKTFLLNKPIHLSVRKLRPVA